MNSKVHVLYISRVGGLGLLWAIAWWLIARDTPQQDNSISEVEERFIFLSLGGDKQKPVSVYLTLQKIAI